MIHKSMFLTLFLMLDEDWLKPNMKKAMKDFFLCGLGKIWTKDLSLRYPLKFMINVI